MNSKTNYFFSEKKFRFLQSGFNSLILSKLQPKYFFFEFFVFSIEIILIFVNGSL